MYQYCHSIHDEDLKKWRQEGAAMMCQFGCSICGEELKKEDKKVQQQCVSTIAVPVVWLKKRREEGAAMMCQKYLWRRADCPPKTQDKLLGLIVDNDNSADAAITITSADDVIIIDDETKKKDRNPWR